MFKWLVPNFPYLEVPLIVFVFIPVRKVLRRLSSCSRATRGLPISVKKGEGLGARRQQER